jgi:hypothetical protein
MVFSELSQRFEWPSFFGDNAGMRTVGQPKHTAIPSPQEAWARGRLLDAMLPSLRQQRPRGVWKLSHRLANQMDDELMIRTASLRQADMHTPYV